jgi:hypothetical protein
MFCSACGHKNDEGAAFCTQCGHSNNNASVTTSEPANPIVGAADAIAGTIKKQSNGVKIAGIAVGAVVLVGGIIALSGGGNPIPGALSSCGLSETSAGVSVDAGGKTVYFDGTGEEDFDGVDFSSVQCVLEALKAPTSIFDRIGSTSALQGVVEGDWSNFHASWTYHPNNGLDLTLETK